MLKRAAAILRDRDAGRVTDTLAEWTGRTRPAYLQILDDRCPGMQLPEAFNLRHWQIVAARVAGKEHRPVTGRENEKVAPNPAGLFGIMFGA